MGIKREDKALREFKEIIGDLLLLLRCSTGAETAYMHWVNRSRRQFVLESHSTSLPNLMFQDRVQFKDHFLDGLKDSHKIVQLDVEDQIEINQLDHYVDPPPVRQLTVIPFVNNAETVALTVLETSGHFPLSEYEASIGSYRNSVGNVLNTYLELTDLYGQQQEWVDYQKSLDKISTRMHKVDILYHTLNEMQGLLPEGGVSLVARGMDVWVNVLNSENASMTPELGLMIDETSIAYASLKNGSPEFAVHFNQNPKRFSTREAETEGATLAIPILIDDRRHGSVIAYDRNSLMFKESVKHKLINFVRIATLAIQANLGKLSMDEDLLTSAHSNFIPDVWEKALKSTLAGSHQLRETWFGYVTIENIQNLRSKHRLEELQRLQRTLVKAMNPSRFGYNGYIGFNSDYVYTFILQNNSETAPQNWISDVRQMLANPVSLSDGQEIDVNIAAGFTQVNGGGGSDFHPIVREAKKSLSQAVKDSNAVDP